MITDNHLENCLDYLDDALTKFDRGIPLSVPERETMKSNIEFCITCIEDVIAERKDAKDKWFYAIKNTENRINDYAFLNYYHLALDGKETYVFFSFMEIKNLLLFAAIKYSTYLRKKGN